MDAMMETISREALDKLGLSEEEAEKIKEAPEQELEVGGHYEGPFSISIKDGKGSYASDPKSTMGVTLTGNFDITAPDGGTWHIVARINNDKPFLDVSSAAKGNKYPFKVKTPFWSKTQIKIDATWNEKENTTLKGDISADY